MRLLIDGYNLLHASGVFASGSGPPTLERSRRALLDFLVEELPPKVLPHALVVFDAAQAPPGLPHEIDHEGLMVRFARRGSTADALLEELIGAEPDPRNLLVVSSDHRVQRAARQRGARFVDSDAWWRELPVARASSPDAESQIDKEKDSPQLDNPFPPGYASDVGEDG
jgi:predicted RNA-binding protein with PIN domain